MPDITPEDWVMRLAAKAEEAEPDTRKYNRHYDLEQPLSYMHPELWLEVSERIKPLLVAWPQVVVDSVEERLDVEGFRFDTQAKNDNRLWDWWQANNLDEGSQQEHLEALICGRGFVIVGASDDPQTPKITVESARQVYADFDPQTRTVRAALKQWVDGKDQFATLYLPNENIYYRRTGGQSLEEYDRDEHGVGVPLVVPFANRGRVLRLNPDGGLRPPGVSELAPIIPLSDAACKIGTDMMVAAETVAIPVALHLRRLAGRVHGLAGEPGLVVENRPRQDAGARGPGHEGRPVDAGEPRQLPRDSERARPHGGRDRCPSAALPRLHHGQPGECRRDPLE